MDKTTKNPIKTEHCEVKGAAEGGPLGITAKSADFLSQHRLAAFAAQSVARGVLPKKHRLCGCLRSKVSKSQPVGVKYSGTARYHGLQTCGSVWACPVCARKISEHRRKELTAALSNWKAQGGSVYLLTLTFPHDRHDDLKVMLAAFSKAMSMFKATAAWKRFHARFGVVGNIRALEVTHGDNGWHPHAHHLVFCKSTRDADQMKQAVMLAWAKSCVKAGLKSPSDAHGVDVRGGDYAHRYVGKWGLEHEMTKAHIKKGKQGGNTPFDLLRVLLNEPESPLAQRAPSLFRQYAEAFHGKRQLYWSDGLRGLLGLTQPEISDEEAAKGDDQVAQLLAALTDAQWRFVVAKNLRGELLEAVNKSGGKAESVHDFLDSHAETDPLPEPPNIDPPKRVRIAPCGRLEAPQRASATRRDVERTAEHSEAPQGRGLLYQASEFSGMNPKGERHPSADPEKRGANPSTPEAVRGKPFFGRANSTAAKHPKGKEGFPSHEVRRGSGTGSAPAEQGG